MTSRLQAYPCSFGHVRARCYTGLWNRPLQQQPVVTARFPTSGSFLWGWAREVGLRAFCSSFGRSDKQPSDRCVVQGTDQGCSKQCTQIKNPRFVACAAHGQTRGGVRVRCSTNRYRIGGSLPSSQAEGFRTGDIRIDNIRTGAMG